MTTVYSRAIRSRRTLSHVALHFRPAMASRQDHPMRSSRLLGPVRTSCLAVTLASTVSLPLAAQGGGAQQGDSTRTNRVQWDVTQARGKTRDIDFTISEGTWMSGDLSPDRTWIAFDL